MKPAILKQSLFFPSDFTDKVLFRSLNVATFGYLNFGTAPKINMKLNHMSALFHPLEVWRQSSFTKVFAQRIIKTM